MIEIRNLTDAQLYLEKVSVVIFDLDDTLYSEKEYVKSGYNAIARSMPNIVQMAEKLWDVFEKRGLPIDEVLKSEGMFSEEKKQECIQIYRWHTPDIHLYDGVEEMILQLKEKGMHIGMITDGRSEGQRAKIKALELEKYFDKIIITDELGGIEYRKPNEKAFVLMQQYFNVDFNQMVYIGDNSKKDFIAPIHLGMHTIHFVNSDGLYND